MSLRALLQLDDIAVPDLDDAVIPTVDDAAIPTVDDAAVPDTDDAAAPDVPTFDDEAFGDGEIAAWTESDAPYFLIGARLRSKNFAEESYVDIAKEFDWTDGNDAPNSFTPWISGGTIDQPTNPTYGTRLESTPGYCNGNAEGDDDDRSNCASTVYDGVYQPLLDDTEFERYANYNWGKILLETNCKWQVNKFPSNNDACDGISSSVVDKYHTDGGCTQGDSEGTADAAFFSYYVVYPANTPSLAVRLGDDFGDGWDSGCDFENAFFKLTKSWCTDTDITTRSSPLTCQEWSDSSDCTIFDKQRKYDSVDRSVEEWYDIDLYSECENNPDAGDVARMAAGAIVGIVVGVLGCAFCVFIFTCNYFRVQRQEAEKRARKAANNAPPPAAQTQMTMPPPAAAGGAQMTVQVPAGVQPGSVLTVATPTGKQIQVQVPAGAVPGSMFTVNY